MSTQIFSLYPFDPPTSAKGTLTKDDVRTLCSHYNQHSQELEDFLIRYDFETWACIGIDIHADYYQNTGDGQMDCSAAEFLGILLTSLGDEQYEQALRDYLKQYPVDGILSFPLNEDNDFDRIQAPIWVLHVPTYAPYELSGVVILPQAFWNANALMSDSAGYGYTVDDRYWYSWDRARSYRLARAGAWSPNFLTTESTPLEGHRRYLYDASHHRFVCVPSKYSSNERIAYYDFNDAATPLISHDFKALGASIQGDHYHIYTKKGLFKTDAAFQILETQNSKTGLMGNQVLQEYHNKGWSVMLTNKGIDIQSPSAQKQDKLSAFKIKAGDAEPRRLAIHALDKQHLLFVSDKLIIVDQELNLTTHSLKKAFKATLKPWLGKETIGVAYLNGVIDIPGRMPFIFLNNLLISLSEDLQPQVLNPLLYKLTGEFEFYGGIADAELGGVWLLAGLERLVFVDYALSKAKVFNTHPTGSKGGGRYPAPIFLQDKDGHLYFSLNKASSVRCVRRAEQLQQLKQAIPYAGQ